MLNSAKKDSCLEAAYHEAIYLQNEDIPNVNCSLEDKTEL